MRLPHRVDTFYYPENFFYRNNYMGIPFVVDFYQPYIYGILLYKKQDAYFQPLK